MMHVKLFPYLQSDVNTFVEQNEIYNFDESVRMQYMHIAVFPLEDESVVLAFYHKRDKLYRQLRHQINSSSQEKVLQYINYLIFEHTENVYFSKKIEEEIKNNKMIEKLSQEANGLPRFGHLSADNMFGIGYEAENQKIYLIS